MKKMNMWVTYHQDEQIKEYSLCEDENTHLFKGNRVDVTGVNLNYLNSFYSEIVTLYWVWKNNVKSEVVGFCHYRRQFHKLLDIRKGECQVLGLNPTSSVFAHYKLAHNYHDLYDVIDIVNDLYGLGNRYAKYLMEGKVFIPFCCFVMHWKDYLRLCNFLFEILFEFDKRNSLNLDPVKYRAKAERDFRYGNIDYQQRYMGFLAERLISSFLVNDMKVLCIKEISRKE